MRLRIVTASVESYFGFLQSRQAFLDVGRSAEVLGVSQESKRLIPDGGEAGKSTHESARPPRMPISSRAAVSWAMPMNLQYTPD